MPETAAPWRILVVDDDPEIHHVTHLVLGDFQFQNRPVELLTATSAAQARHILQTETGIAVLLLDVVMETDDAGLQLVAYVRKTLGLKALRIILRTGQPGQAPERDVILRYDIDDYRAKTEMTAQKLMTSTVAGLRAYEAFSALERNREALAASNQELERRVVERTRALEASEASLRALISAVPEGIVSYDLDGTIRSFSQAAEDMFGWSSADIVGRSITQIVPDALKAANTPLTDLRGRRWDGEAFPLDMSVNRAEIDGVQVLVVVLRDVTERNRTQEDLRRARDAAEAASRVKSDFLAMMSHEIRTPMNGILGMVQLLSDTGLNPVQLDYAETIHGSANALLAVLNDILDFSKLETGHFNLEDSAFDPARVVSQVVQLMDLRAREKQLKLSLNLAPGLPPVVMGDPGRLRQVLLNLLSNALKFTERGAITVSLTVEAASAGQIGLRFAVSDTGIGIPREAQPRLFQKFEQVDGTISRRFGGTGLGLAISRRIIDLMGGEIGLDSEEGKGSTFWFAVNFPLRADGAMKPPLPPGELVAERPSLAPPRLRVLLVEDDSVSRKVACTFLDRLGHTAVVAEDGLGAVARVSAEGAQAFDVILLDLQLPDMDGFSCVTALRALDEDAGAIPVIALTASASAEDVTRTQQHGFLGLLPKPLIESDLKAMLRKVAEARASAGAPGVLNEATLAALEGALGSEGMRHLIAMFITDARALAQSIVQAVASGEVSRIDGLTRELHETAAQFGLDGVRAEARALGAALRDGIEGEPLATAARLLDCMVAEGTSALARRYTAQGDAG